MEDSAEECDGMGWSLSPRDHQRTIIHLDADCFYAQVEMVRNPTLRHKPLGIKQKNLMVTCNYEARARGVKKTMWIKEALEALPELVLVDGSDLTNYRQFSAQVSAVAQEFTPSVERLGLDENFVDVTDIVGDYVSDSNNADVEGHVYGDKEPSSVDLGDPCMCGCFKRLIAGSLVASKLRQQILESTGITVCAGIAHNKLLAKLVSGYYKPNQQTVVFPWQVHSVMKSLNSARSIPGIGSATFKTLEELGISSVQELQHASLPLLTTRFDKETSRKLRDISYGIDDTPVKRSGRAQSIGLEDAFTKVNSIAEVRIRYHALIERLLKLVAEDGRVPVSLRVCVRKYDRSKRFGHRESRQTPISPSLFPHGVRNINDNSKSSLMKIVMVLFHKIVDTSQDYHLTLLGVGFNKFIERATEAQAISSFFMKYSKVEDTEAKLKSIEGDRQKRRKGCEPVKQEFSCGNDGNCDGSLIEYLPVNIDRMSSNEFPQFDEVCDSGREEKDRKKDIKCNITDCNVDNVTLEGRSSSNKNPVQLSDNSSNICYAKSNTNGCSRTVDSLSEVTLTPEQMQTYNEILPASEASNGGCLPSEVDPEVFKSLPSEVQDEVLRAYSVKNQGTNCASSDFSKTKQKNEKTMSFKHTRLDKYFRVRQEKKGTGEKGKSQAALDENKTAESGNIASCSNFASKSEQTAQIRGSTSSYAANHNTASVAIPYSPTISDFCLTTKGLDPDVFRSLPEEIQQEILKAHERPAVKEQVFPKSQSHIKSPKGVQKLKTVSSNNSGLPSILKYLKKV